VPVIPASQEAQVGFSLKAILGKTIAKALSSSPTTTKKKGKKIHIRRYFLPNPSRNNIPIYTSRNGEEAISFIYLPMLVFLILPKKK
jgi:hypothetical protein